MNKKTIDQLISILKKDSKRALKMKVKGFPTPYYGSFLLRDTEWFNTWSSSGSVYRKKADHTRNVYADIRVGNYKYDQVMFGGLLDNDDELESYSHVRAPIDDKCYDGLRIALWRLSEAKFREALTDYNTKESNQLSTINPNKRLKSFRKLPSLKDIKYSRNEYIDESKWSKYCSKASSYLSQLPRINSNWVEFDGSQVTKIFVSTENRIIVQSEKVFTLSAGIRKLTKEGIQLEQELVINSATLNELPSLNEFKKRMMIKYKQLMQLEKAKKIHSFSGPVLLKQLPAGLLFHEAIGHRLEGNRLLYSGEGQTFKGQVGKKVFNLPIDFYDDPTLKKFKGRKCIGSYNYDDEGSQGERADLVKDGILTGFLNTRSQIPAENSKPNGHARNLKHQRPISRMSVTVVKGKETVSEDELKKLLIKEIKDQGKPFGMIVYETAGGETDTASFDFQAFSGEISFATLVYPSGKEVPVKGVDFVGTPLQSLNNIIAVGDEQKLDNHYCGAESGLIPVSTIAPSVLIKNLELQSKEEDLVTPYLLKKPRLD